MSKHVNSWSKPDNHPGLIARKQVDKSMFQEGSHVPEAFHIDFMTANGGEIPRVGEERHLTLIWQGTEFSAKMVHQARPYEEGRRLVIFHRGGGFGELLRRQLPYSYERLVKQRTDDVIANVNSHREPDLQPEYIDFYETGTPYRYEVKFVPASVTNGMPRWNIPATFDEVWSELGRVLPPQTVIATLVHGASNTVTWTEKGIEVTTDRGTELLPKVMFELAWQSLVQSGIVAADNFPGEARFRSAAVSAILARLPYVEYTSYPRTTLFLKTHHFTNAQLSETFKVGQQRGIRVAGKSPNTKLVVFTTDFGDTPDPDHPYKDRWEGEHFLYTGEGLQGDQQLSYGNLALKNNIANDFPVYGFRKVPTGGYQYISRFKVQEVREEQQPDQAGTPRRVFMFVMKPISPLPPNGSVEPPVTQPRYFRVAGPVDPDLWAVCQQAGHVRLAGWPDAGDLSRYSDAAALEAALVREAPSDYLQDGALIKQRAQELWTFAHLTSGDRLIVTRGPSTVIGLAEVIGDGHRRVVTEVAGHQTVLVRWAWTGHRRVGRHPRWETELVSPASAELYDRIKNGQGQTADPNFDLSVIAERFGLTLQSSGITFGANHNAVVRSFIASLATKRLVILTGLSGSGKTQIALRLGDWLGEGRRKVVAVRPDWTGPEPLFGYEDALARREDQKKVWNVPEVLAFMLKAAADPDFPYLLILDEMNLAHVERYFADFLSGLESGEGCLPDLVEVDGQWIVQSDKRLPMPENLFVVGTVNVDETTYMFSPKVLDRANTFEFRVETDDLAPTARKPVPCAPGDDALVRGFLAIAADDTWHLQHPADDLGTYVEHLRTLHRLLAGDGFEFGHRVFYEAIRFAAMLKAAGDAEPLHALDRVVMQKILPRLHGTRRRLEDTLCALGRFCCELTFDESAERFNFEKMPRDAVKRLPISFDKVHRMTKRLRANQFASFTE